MSTWALIFKAMLAQPIFHNFMNTLLNPTRMAINKEGNKSKSKNPQYLLNSNRYITKESIGRLLNTYGCSLKNL